VALEQLEEADPVALVLQVGGEELAHRGVE
jgi:hypothetical protein